MRVSTAILLGSLATQAALLAVFLARRVAPPAANIPAAVSIPKPVPPAPPDPLAHINPETWRALAQGGDLSELVARLRAKGYPPAVLRAIVRTQVREHFADRLAPLIAAAAAEPYWRGSFNPFWNSKVLAARRALEREIAGQVRELLGADWQPDETPPSELRRRFGDLPHDKLLAVARINADYQELGSQVRQDARGILLPEDRERIEFLERERRADLARLLTPEELENYDLRSSQTSSALRSRLLAFEPSEEEFRSLFRLHQSLDAQFGSPESSTPELRRKRAEAEKQLDPQIAAALGPERYADYQRMTDPAWQQTARYVQERNLTPSLTGQLMTIQQDISRRAEVLRADKTITPEQRGLQIAALEQEATHRLTPLLGDQLNQYKRTAGYLWLQSLRPATPR